MARRKEPEPIPEPPEGLSAHGREVWAAVVHEIDGAARRELLAVALAALDRANESARLINQQGLLATSKRSRLARPHALAALERDSRRQFIGIWRSLGFTRTNEWEGL